jgi:hypothetical protein
MWLAALLGTHRFGFAGFRSPKRANPAKAGDAKSPV